MMSLSTTDDELTCIRCGYSLRTLTPERDCPECGCAVEASIDAWRRPPGITPLLRAGVLLMALAAGVAMAVPFLPSRPAAFVAVFAAALLATLAMPLIVCFPWHRHRLRSLRHATVVIVAALLAWSIVPAMMLVPRVDVLIDPPWKASVIIVLFGAAATMAFAGTQWKLAAIAGSHDRARLARATRLLAILLLLVAAVFFPGFALSIFRLLHYYNTGAPDTFFWRSLVPFLVTAGGWTLCAWLIGTFAQSVWWLLALRPDRRP